MFLAELSEKQKVSFLSLAHKLISADGIMNPSELSMLAQYKMEMGLPASSELVIQDVQETIPNFSDAPSSIKKKVLFELVALACSDDDYDTSEHSLLKSICTSFDLDNSFLVTSKEYVGKLMSLYAEINELVHN